MKSEQGKEKAMAREAVTMERVKGREEKKVSLLYLIRQRYGLILMIRLKEIEQRRLGSRICTDCQVLSAEVTEIGDALAVPQEYGWLVGRNLMGAI
jgi:hypothetical protein